MPWGLVILSFCQRGTIKGNIPVFVMEVSAQNEIVAPYDYNCSEPLKSLF